ncbi:MAG: sigma-70 family RNA polymerase sigma factor, partial [Polyangiaceae bacterium]
MLGSSNDADDAIQESWLRLSQSSEVEIDNLGGWLTTAVARISLDMLRKRKLRREDRRGISILNTPASHERATDPEQERLLADSVGHALVVVLETLAPAERIAFVLHDLFGVPFDDIAVIVDRSIPAAKQLASRARRRVHGGEHTSEAVLARQTAVVRAFLRATRDGDLDVVLAVLDPTVI